MPTDPENVCYSGKTGSRGHSSTMTRLADRPWRSRHRASRQHPGVLGRTPSRRVDGQKPRADPAGTDGRHPNSVIRVDNVETTGNAGTNGITASDFLNLGAFTGGSSFFGGSVVELGIDFTVHNGTARTAMCHNQFAYWATSTSC